MRERLASTSVWVRMMNGAPRRARRARAACVGGLVLLALVGGAVVSGPVAGQETADGDVVRIVARKLDDGRVEFALQQRQPDSTWGDRQLPRVRFFPTSAGENRWLASSPLDLPAGAVRIVARRLDDGRVEFALQQRQRRTAPGATGGCPACGSSRPPPGSAAGSPARR